MPPKHAEAATLALHVLNILGLLWEDEHAGDAVALSSQTLMQSQQVLTGPQVLLDAMRSFPADVDAGRVQEQR